MRPLRYSINVSLDGCCDHAALPADDTDLSELHERSAAQLARADALLLGRVTYTMMEEAFRSPGGVAWDPADPFARTIDAARKYVVSSTLEHVDWNAELLDGDVPAAVEQLKAQPGEGIMTGGVQLPRALAAWGLIDEYELVVHPCLVGRGPTLFAGLGEVVELELVDVERFASGPVALRYVPRT